MALGFLKKLFTTPAPERAHRKTLSVDPVDDYDYEDRNHQESLVKPGTADPNQGYRRLSKSDDRRDLDPVKYDWHLRLANWLWASHPIAKKCLQNHKNFICGSGFRVQSLCEDDNKRKALQSLFDKHWEINEWDRELSRRVESLAVEGEWIYYCPPPEEGTGHFKMAKIMAENVKEIERDREDAERLRYVVMAKAITEATGVNENVKDRLEIAYRHWREGIQGDTLYLGINRLSGQTRGFSDLLAVADHLDLFDTILFTEAERIGIQRAFVWDVAIETRPGSGGDKVKDRRRELRKQGPPRPGALNVHDSTEKWTTVSPELHLGETIEFTKFLMSLTLGGLHNPEHWFAEGGNTNKATSDNQQGPAFAFIRERKREIMEFQKLELEIAIQRWQEAGMLAGLGALTRDDLRFQIVSRDPEQTAYEAIGAVLQALGQGLQIGQTQGWFSDQEAARAYREAASHLGLGDFPGLPPAGTLEQAKLIVTQAMKGLNSGAESPLAVKTFSSDIKPKQLEAPSNG